MTNLSSTKKAAPSERIVPSWLPITVLVLCGLGAVVSFFLTYEALFSEVTLACPEGETINCAKVTESEWSTSWSCCSSARS